jgi:hypothetical protein
MIHIVPSSGLQPFSVTHLPTLTDQDAMTQVQQEFHKSNQLQLLVVLLLVVRITVVLQISTRLKFIKTKLSILQLHQLKEVMNNFLMSVSLSKENLLTHSRTKWIINIVKQ